MTLYDVALILKGGVGSGNFGHAGRHGEVGGSASKGTGGLLFREEANFSTNYKPLAVQKATSLAKKTGIPHKVIQVGDQYQVIKQDKKPPKPIAKSGAQQKSSAQELNGTTILADTNEQHAEVQKVLKQIPSWHLQNASNKSRLAKVNVHDQPNLNSIVEALEQKSLAKGVSVTGFSDGEGLIAIAGKALNFKQTIAHEIGHVVFEDANNNAEARTRIKKIRAKLDKLYSSDRQTVSKYAQSSKAEYAAEIYGHYVANQSYVQRADPEAYAVIKEMFD